jgi:branched-chain amino acid aminotransferase
MMMLSHEERIMKVWLNGRLVDSEQACINVYDHGLLYGDGVFEGIRVYGGKVFRAQAHMDRLFDSAKRIRLVPPYTRQELLDATYEALRANGMTDAYVRMVITRGRGNLGLNPFTCERASAFVIVDKIHLYPPEMYEHGMSVIIARTLRTSASMVDPSAKSLNYLNNILAKIEAIDANVPEAVMLNADGNVAECTGDNLFLVKDGTLVTPPTSAGILVGITRSVVVELAKKGGIPLVEKNVKPKDLYAADECFLTGTAAEVVAVTKVDEETIGDGKVGPVSRRLTKAFREYVNSGQFE